MNPKMKPPGTKRLKLEYDGPPSNFAFKFNLRRYNVVVRDETRPISDPGRAVQVDRIKPMLKPPGTKLLKLNCDILLSTSAFKFKLRRYTQATCA